MRVLQALAVGAALPAVVAAQAWTGEPGATSVFLGYGNNWTTKHYTYQGNETDGGHTRAQVVTFGISHVLAERWSMSAYLPLVQAKYMGSRPHPGSDVDTGDYHISAQDLHLEIRYQAWDGSVAFTPFLAAGWPTHDYETLGHAAAGRGLDQYIAGFYVGGSLDRWIPATYVQARYGYAWVEAVAGIHPNRSNLDLEIGHFLTERLAVRAIGSWQETHGGIDSVGGIPLSHPLFPYHDQLGDESYVNAGVGASYALSDEVEISASYVRSFSGRNGHKLDDGLSLGFAYTCRCLFGQAGESTIDSDR